MQGLAKGPSYLTQLEGAAVAATGLEGVKKAAGIHPHAAQVGRVEAGQCRRGVGGVGKAVSAYLSVAPWLPAQPFQSIVTVRPLGYIFAEPSFRSVASPAVLQYCDVAVANEEPGLQGPFLGGLGL